MRTNKNTSKIILAVTVAFLATLVSYSAFSKMNSQISEQSKLIDLMQKTTAEQYKEDYAYAVAKKDLKAGEIVSDEDVDFKNFANINSSAFENRSEVVNKILLKDITGGEQFTNAHIAKVSSDDVQLKEGFRALTLPAENFQGKSDKMVPGSKVDIYSASKDSDWAMENVKILAVEGSRASKGPQTVTSANAITFEVSADDIADFISNVSRNKLVLVARNANDTKRVHRKSPSSYSEPNIGSIPSSMPALPTLPAPIGPPSDKGGGNIYGLPQPIKPIAQPQTVELIEANVKSKVTFD